MAELEYGKFPVEPEFWFVTSGLYHTEDYKFKDCMSHEFDHFRQNIISVIFPEITIDVYCPSCKRETVFNPVKRENDWFKGSVIAPAPSILSFCLLFCFVVLEIILHLNF